MTEPSAAPGSHEPNDLEDLQSRVGRWLGKRGGVTVLEAGCGSTSHLDLAGVARIVGIDISEAQLRRHPQLDERILGDLQTYPLPAAGYDLIVSWDVLEHLSEPEAALEILFRALKGDGLMVLAFPHLLSLKGLLTRYTGYGFHLLFYRRVIGDRRSMDQGFGQFPTYLRDAIQPDRLIERAKRAGLELEYLKLYEGPVQRHVRKRYPLADWMLGAVGTLSRWATSGRHDLTNSDVILVFRRPAAEALDSIG